MRPSAAVAIAALLTWTAACSDDSAPLGVTGSCVPDAAGVETMLRGACSQATCHGGGDPAAGLDLESAGGVQAMVERSAATCGRMLVVPSSPEASLLFEKIVSDSPECGERMPLAGVLPATDIECVRQWIDSLKGGCESCGGASCIDIDSDASHCGACGAACPEGARCVSGSCACPPIEDACGGSCVLTASNPDHCGACDNACPAMLVCSLGACKAGCDGGLTACDGACIDIAASADHCGGCGIDCGSGSCQSGSCVCAADTDNDPNNCGSCGNSCAPGQSCVAGLCTCATASVSFASDVEPMLSSNCASNGCHSGVKPQAKLDLRPGAAYGSMVNVPADQCSDGRLRVAPGDPAASYVLDKIAGTKLCFGTKMPKLGSVAAADTQLLTTWICNGAPNN